MKDSVFSFPISSQAAFDGLAHIRMEPDGEQAEYDFTFPLGACFVDYSGIFGQLSDHVTD